MLDPYNPYHMVFINLIVFILFILGILFYKYIFPKRNINLFVLLILISSISLISLLRPGDYESGDFNIHLFRIMAFYDSLSEGHIMPSWAGQLNATYGNPLFLLNYPLPYYIVSFFHFLGFSFVTSMKIFFGATFLFSGIFMYMAMKKVLKSDIGAFTAAVFYLFNPYHLSDIHFRATLGESTLFMIAPLLLYSVISFLRERKIIYLIFISLITILLSLSHPFVSLTIHGLVIIFATTIKEVKKRMRSLLYVFSAIGVGFIASLYVWVPFLIFSNITYLNPNETMQFRPFLELFYSPYYFGLLFQGYNGELPYSIGYAQLIVTTIGIILLIKTKYFKKLGLQFSIWIIILAILIFLMHPISGFIWQHFRMFWMFTDRLLLAMAICTSIIAGYVAVYFSRKILYKKILYIIVFIVILSTLPNWAHRDVLPHIGDQQLREKVWQSSIIEGFVPFLNSKWGDPQLSVFTQLPKDHLEIISGKGEVIELSRTSTKHAYVINSQTQITIKENTLWWPGWELKSNNKTIDIYPGKAGIIYAKLPPGLQYVELTYEDIPLIKTFKQISIITSILLLIALVCSFLGHPKNFPRNL